MKIGKPLEVLMAEIERRANAKQDFIAPSDKISGITTNVGGAQTFALALTGQDAFTMTNHAHGQLAEYLKIPRVYYDRMRVEAPDLLATSANRWFQDCIDPKTKVPARRMVRTLFGECRALLSDRYRTYENEDVAAVVIPMLREMGCLILSADITETRFYIKAVDQRITLDIPRGAAMGDGGHTIFDTVSPAISLTNSEVGKGRLGIDTSVFTKACTNMMTIGVSLKKYHTGARAELSEDVYALLTDETRSATDEAFWLQLRDVTRGAFAEAQFKANTDRLIEATQDVILDSPVEVITRAQKKFSWTNPERDQVLRHMVMGGDMTRYGLHSAVTRAAADLPDYDRATEFEALGGEIISLPKQDWKVLAEAA